MYLKFYGLREKPFSILPDPSYLYMSKVHNRALVLLRYSLISGQGFTVLSGEIGSGKTTLVNKLIDGLEDDINVGVLSFTQDSPDSIMEWVAMTYGLEFAGKSEAGVYDLFLKFLIDEYAAGRKVVLIVDEAQNMGLKGLEKLRMLSNVNARKDYLLHMILVGQPELRTLIRAPQLKQLLQRIAVAYHLDAMTDDETADYIRHRITTAGGNPEIFSDEAMRILVAASDGVPRVINSLCDLALVYGYSSKKACIDAEIARSVLDDRISMGLVTTRHQVGAGPLVRDGKSQAS